MTTTTKDREFVEKIQDDVEQGIPKSDDGDTDTNSTGSSPPTSDADDDSAKELSDPRIHRALEVLFVTAVISSLSSIFIAYSRAWDDMQDDPDWSISRILAYDYNLFLCYLGVLPSFLILVFTYLGKHYRKTYVRYACAVGFLGGVLAFSLDVEGYPIWHGFAAFLLLLAAVLLRKDANQWQTAVCGIGFVLAIASCGFRLVFRHYAFGLTMALGEFFILTPWVFMMFNPA